MLFGQLTNRESLRDLIVALDAHSGKSYHLGLGKSVTRSNFAKANEVRNSKIFEDFAYHLIAIARELHSCDDFKIKGNIYAFDSSTIGLCLNVFWWAKFRKAKGGIKLHTLYDVNTQIPAFLHITAANVHDVKAMDELVYEAGGHYIFDRAYLDYTRLYKIERCSAYFVVRAKSNTKFRRMYSNKADKLTGIRCDQIGKLSGFYTSQEYPKKLRRVKYYDKESNRTFVFLTNNLKVTASDVALLYKKRWQVELFFKWVKQHLKIKSFWGTSENAVKIQIYSAISAYCLVSIVADKLKLERSTYEILQVLGISLLDKTPINELFMNIDYSNVKELNYNQLSLSLFYINSLKFIVMQIRIISLAIISLGVSLMVSCKDQEKNVANPSQIEVETTNSNAKTTASLNPEHGLPGHRCDIPVGAPLDQAEGKTKTQNPPPVSTGISPVWTKDAAPVKNPPHGQPGHDCSVPVGADLKK